MSTFSHNSPHVCCQVYQVPSLSQQHCHGSHRIIPTSIHKYLSSVSCHVPRCPVPSQHMSHRMRPNELPQNTFSIRHPSRTVLGLVLQVHISHFLGTHGIEFRFHPRQRQIEIPGGKNRFVDDLHLRDPGHNPTNNELHWKDLL